MNCVILQPSYIPWRGYFHQVQKAEVFVFYDDVQYDSRGWRHRNRVKGPQGAQWLTIPVHHRGSQTRGTPICEIPICWDTPWNERHWRTLRQFYGKAPHFSRYAESLEACYLKRPRLLADFTTETTMVIAGLLGIKGTRFLRSSQLAGEGHKTERLLNVLKAVGADHYLSGPSAKEYLDEALL
ncbi:MAG TPA: WbqC family protein, partial [Pirellulales bacterium]|nr:WbqC family protein [Pirellulales bacterium]